MTERNGQENQETDFQPTGRLLINAFRAFEKKLLYGLQQQNFSDITLSHLNVIRHLNPEGMKLIELANDAALSKQAISKICSNLEQKNYIEIVNDSNDGRAKMVHFTQKGIRLIDTAIKTTRKIELQYCTTLGDKDYKQLRDSLQNLLREAKL